MMINGRTSHGGARNAKKVQDLGKILMKEESATRYKQVSDILKIPFDERTAAHKELLQIYPEIVTRCEQNRAKRDRTKARLEELADGPAELEEKCLKLAAAVQRAERLIVYTGAGISTAADIPDYRGPNGVWTMKERGLPVRTRDLCEAEPTFTHMALVQLMRQGKLEYLISQNCDGLHVRSGIDRKKLSEIHGNMFLEICPSCTERREYMRIFDTTERTGVRRHETGRRCHICHTELKDSIVHFGEKGTMLSPYCWEEARAAAETSDMILCLGTSLKILRKYPCLWCMDRKKMDRPSLYIVNLQWTPKDDIAELKINGNCDDVMRRVMQKLNISVAPYQRYYDPLFLYHIPLRPEELNTCTKKFLVPGELMSDHTYAQVNRMRRAGEEPSSTDSKRDKSHLDVLLNCASQGTGAATPQEAVSSPGWYGVGIRNSKTKPRKKRR